MPKSSAVTDQSLRQALSLYAGMANLVLADPARWLGTDAGPDASASLPARALDAVRDKVFGDITPASPNWGQQPLRKRTGWWVNRIGTLLGLAAATPRFAGALADRLPLQAALGASAAGLAVCAVARESGVTAPAAWVPLLARVLFDRELAAQSDVMPSTEEANDQLAAAAVDVREPPSQLAALGQAAQSAVRILWRLGRILFAVDDLLDERPRGRLLARGLAKLPVVGIAGGWLDERGGIRRAARETEALLSSPGAR